MEGTNEYGQQIQDRISFENKKAIMANSKIPEALRHYKWSDYLPHVIEGQPVTDNSVIRSREEAKIHCKKYTLDLVNHYEKIKENPEQDFKKFPSLIIYGPETSGKTVLATLIARTLAEKCEKTILFVDFMDLNSVVYTIMDFRSETFTVMLERYLNPDILIIDEVAKSKMAPMIEPFLSALIRQRQNSDRSKITIITSKVVPNGIEKLIGMDCGRIVKKKRDFSSVEILAENPHRLESYDEESYDLRTLNNLIYYDVMGGNKAYNGVITESQLRHILARCVADDKRKKRR